MARTRKPTKKECERLHARRRAAERYGAWWNSEQNAAVRRQIEEGTALHLRKQSLRVSLWEVTLLDGQTAHVVYDRQRKEVVTLLPFDTELSERAKAERVIPVLRSETKDPKSEALARLNDELLAVWCA